MLSVMILEVRWPTWLDFCLAKTGAMCGPMWTAIQSPLLYYIPYLLMQSMDALGGSLTDTRYFVNPLVLVPTDNS